MVTSEGVTDGDEKGRYTMNNFHKVCPTGNHMLNEVKTPRDREYTAEQEDQDMEDYYDRKAEKDLHPDREGHIPDR